MTPIRIATDGFAFRAELSDSPTAQAIARALPLRGRIHRWGGEIYFTIPLQLELEPGSREVLEPGELGYWPTGAAFCVFFGPTPASKGSEPRAASAVNVFGKVTGPLEDLWQTRDGAAITIEAV